MMRLLCFLGLHAWRREQDGLGDCGMGSEWFQIWTCKRCRSTFDQVRRLPTDRRGQGHMCMMHRDLRARWKPKAIESFFKTGLCPDCGHSEFYSSQDGGHDQLLECAQCHSRFGIQDPPFCLIERLQVRNK